jgi:nucleoid DNA-binding protein
MERMTKQRLVKVLRKRLEKRLPKKEWAKAEIVEAVVDELPKLIMEEVWKGRVVSIRNFGKFYIRKSAQRVARNPKTGEKINLPVRLVPVFKAGKGFKDLRKKQKEE